MQEGNDVANKILCIVAGQRSGTTALQSAIASTGQFHDFGEIFQTTEVRRPGCFLNFATERNLTVAQMAPERAAKDIIQDYLEYVTALAGEKFPLIDIKFNSWNALRSFWTYPTQEPQMLQVLRNNDTAFIYVVRKDLAAQIISERIARATSKWHNLTAEDVGETIVVPLAQARKQARLILAAERMLLSYLLPVKRVFPVWYEDLYQQDGSIDPDLSAWLSDQFQVEIPAPMRPAIQKNTVSKKQVVENYAEIVEEISAIVAKQGRVSFPSRRSRQRRTDTRPPSASPDAAS